MNNINNWRINQRYILVYYRYKLVRFSRIYRMWLPRPVLIFLHPAIIKGTVHIHQFHNIQISFIFFFEQYISRYLRNNYRQLSMLIEISNMQQQK